MLCCMFWQANQDKRFTAGRHYDFIGFFISVFGSSLRWVNTHQAAVWLNQKSRVGTSDDELRHMSQVLHKRTQGLAPQFETFPGKVWRLFVFFHQLRRTKEFATASGWVRFPNQVSAETLQFIDAGFKCRYVHVHQQRFWNSRFHFGKKNKQVQMIRLN